MKKKFDKVVAIALLLSQFVTFVGADTIRWNTKLGQSRLEYYLDRASIQREAQAWERLAEEGLLQAMKEWETGNLYLREIAGEEWEGAQIQAQKGYEEEINKAYSEWYSKRYYEEKVILERTNLANALHLASSKWTFDDGSEQKNRIVHMQDAEVAKDQWELQASQIIEEYIAQWEQKSNIAYSELLQRFDRTDRDSFEILISQIKDDYREYVIKEYGRIATAEGNALLMEVLYDQESLKKKSSAEAAAILAQELAKNAKLETDQNFASLFSDFETLIESVDENDIEIAQQNWLYQFKNAFDKNLEKWEQAELRL